MNGSLRKFAVAAVAMGAIVGGYTTITAAPAQAVGGNCTSERQHRGQIGLDDYRARARCSSLQADSKARAKLIRDGGPDYHSAYFTGLNTWHYTGWYTCYAGCRAAHEIAQVG